MSDITVDLDPVTTLIAPAGESATDKFKAGFLSQKGLILALGITSERQQGYMEVQGVDDWYSKLLATHHIGYIPDGSGSTGNWPYGPTGGWKDEWWSVQNYLLYGGQACIGATGTNTNTVSPTETLKTSDSRFNVIFGATGGVNNELITIAGSRQDCVAICNLAVTQDIGTNLTKVNAPPGTSGDKYTFYVAGSKYHLNNTNLSSTSEDENTLLLTPLSADAAGCFTRTFKTAQPWSSPAGLQRGRILGVVRLQQTLTSTSATTLYSNNINPVRTFPGEGTFLFGDKTRRQSTENINYTYVNVTNLVVYLRKAIGDISRRILFEINNTSTRNVFINATTPLLRSVSTSGGISEFKIVCDTTNNTTAIIEANKFVADIYIKPLKSIQTIQLRFTNLLPAQNIPGQDDRGPTPLGGDSPVLTGGY